MRGLTVLVGVLLVRSIAAQQQSCYAASSCSTCLSATGCSWCSAYSDCASSTDSYCPVPLSSTCPVAPTASAVAWPRAAPLGFVAVGLVAIAALAFFTFSSADDSSGAQVASPPQSADVLFVFAAASALWLGASLALAAPAVPWLVYASVYGSVGFTFSTYYHCQKVTYNTLTQVCDTFSSLEYLSALSTANVLSGNDEAMATQYVNSGVALGSFMYIAIISCLLPAAVMTSFAAYRLKRFASLGIPPYFVGFSATSLYVAQILAWVGFAIVSIAWAAALGVCNSVSSTYSAVIISAAFMGQGRGGSPSSDTTLSYASMPGPVLSGLAFAFLLVGSALTSHAANRLHGVLGVGCTARYCRSAHAEQQQHWQQAAPQDAPPPPQQQPLQELQLQQQQRPYGAPQQVPYEYASAAPSSDPRAGLLSLTHQPPAPSLPPRFMVAYKA